MLTVEGLDVAYGDFQVVWDAALQVAAGEIVCLLGPNGAGKSTVMNTISGLLRPRAGRITFKGKRIDGLPPHRTVAEGLAHVLERRRLFPFLTVADNVLLGAHNPRARAHRAETLGRVERIFPVVRQRRDTPVRGAQVGGLGEEPGTLARVEARLPGPAAGQQRVHLPAERAHEVGHEAQGFGREDDVGRRVARRLERDAGRQVQARGGPGHGTPLPCD